MKAIVYNSYGPAEVLKLAEIEKPVPKDNQLLIKVHASTVNMADIRLRKPDPFLARMFNGILKPKRITTPGVEFAGVVEEIGREVTKFKVGDEIYGASPSAGGANAEYFVLGENQVVAPKPSNFSFEEAATIPWGGLAAMHYLKEGNVTTGKRILIYGASGSVGTIAVQLAKELGAEVVGLCSTKNVELVKSLGADEVVDYTREDFAEKPEVYDYIFDTIGKSDISKGLKALKPGGIYLMASSSSLIEPIIKGLFSGSKKIIGGIAKYKGGTLEYFNELAEAGKLRAVIDRTYTLDQIVEASQYVETGHKVGNVVIKI